MDSELVQVRDHLEKVFIQEKSLLESVGSVWEFWSKLIQDLTLLVILVRAIERQSLVELEVRHPFDSLHSRF